MLNHLRSIHLECGGVLDGYRYAQPILRDGGVHYGWGLVLYFPRVQS